VTNEKGLKKIVLKIDGGLPSSILMILDCDTWHNINMPCGILDFGQNKLKLIFRCVVGLGRLMNIFNFFWV